LESLRALTESPSNQAPGRGRIFNDRTTPGENGANPLRLAIHQAVIPVERITECDCD